MQRNRKRRIIEDGPEKRTDFPWIKTFGDMAEEISGVLHQGSVISICGGVETRSFERKIICENCGEEFERKEYATEIVPYFIDYVDNCDIPVKHEDEFVDSENESYINSEEIDLDKKIIRMIMMKAMTIMEMIMTIIMIVMKMMDMTKASSRKGNLYTDCCLQ